MPGALGKASLVLYQIAEALKVFYHLFPVPIFLVLQHLIHLCLHPSVSFTVGFPLFRTAPFLEL